jgi:hypothetical protein
MKAVKPARTTVEKIGFRKGSRVEVQKALLNHLVRIIQIQTENSDNSAANLGVPVQLEFDFNRTEVPKREKVS